MKALKAVCLLAVTLAVLALPVTQAVSQGLMSKTVVRDVGAGPFPPPPHVL